MSNAWDSDIMDDLDDDDFVDDDLDDDFVDDDMSLEDGGDELSGDDEQLSDEELSADYAVSDHGVQALSADRGAAMHQARILGDVSDGTKDKKLSGGAEITQIVVHFGNGRKLYLKP